MRRVLITGAGGFVGSHLAGTLMRSGFEVVAAVRRAPSEIPGGLRYVEIGDIKAYRAWEGVLKDVDLVVHLAARAHVIKDEADDPLSEFRACNVVPTLNLFRACQLAGVKRFIFVSSIGVNGVRTDGRPFREADTPCPTEPYAISKWEAEQALRTSACEGSTELVILRPVLMYGPNVKGNFLRLMQLVASGWPVPFGAISAVRSVLGLTNFCELVFLCATHPQAAGETFLVAETPSVTFPQLTWAIGEAMGRNVRMLNVPPAILKMAGALTGRRGDVSRLLTSLEVDSARVRTVLGWTPGVEFSREIGAMVHAFNRR